MAQVSVAKRVVYPETDGMSIAETDRHYKTMTNLRFGLEFFFRRSDDVYVSGNLFIYREEGNPKKCLAPDTFVVFSVPKHERSVYLLWEEGKGADVVFEITSKRTRNEDLGRKFDIYQGILGVQELFLFDPLREYLEPPLVGYYRKRNDLVKVLPKEGRIKSEVLGLDVVMYGEELRLSDPQTQSFLPTPKELLQQA